MLVSIVESRLSIYDDMNQVIFKDLRRMSYKQAWDLQQKYLQAAVDVKRYNRKIEAEQHLPQKHHLLFCVNIN